MVNNELIRIKTKMTDLDDLFKPGGGRASVEAISKRVLGFNNRST